MDNEKPENTGEIQVNRDEKGRFITRELFLNYD